MKILSATCMSGRLKNFAHATAKTRSSRRCGRRICLLAQSHSCVVSILSSLWGPKSTQKASLLGFAKIASFRSSTEVSSIFDRDYLYHVESVFVLSEEGGRKEGGMGNSEVEWGKKGGDEITYRRRQRSERTTSRACAETRKSETSAIESFAEFFCKPDGETE